MAWFNDRGRSPERSAGAGGRLRVIAHTAAACGVPVVHSTVNVASGQGPTLPELAGLLAEDKPLDRTTVNSWEDPEFVQAVHATGRRKLILCALWTEI